MPPIVKIKKEDILNTAYEIARTEGLEGLNARLLAKKLNCSIQPIFYNFKTMDELKKELFVKIMETYHKYMTSNLDGQTPYRQTGMNYIRFAKEEPKLFHIIFMTPTTLSPEKFMIHDSTFEIIEKYAGNITKLPKEDIRKFHVKMWFFTHGIATLVATKTCEFTEEQISELLYQEYQALMKLESEKK